MDFIDLAKKRFSSRNYSPEKVERDLLLSVLDAGRIAPSAANKQPWIFILLIDAESLNQLSASYDRGWFKTAPAAIVICGDHRQSWKRSDGKDHCDIDTAIATDHITLAAADKGLATCWICNFDKEKCKEVLNLPDHIEPTVILSIGYPLDNKDTNRHTEDRKPLDKIVYFEHFK
ncbi:nitroreductase family protein [Bacteroidota bacterium]